VVMQALAYHVCGLYLMNFMTNYLYLLHNLELHNQDVFVLLFTQVNT
jgi:hypothetical protein